MAAEFAGRVAVNALWPRSVIATAAIAMLGGRVLPEQCRTPAIVADAAHAILTRDSRSCSGNFFIDEAVLHEAGITDFAPYAVKPGATLQPDLFLE
jgi:citronellol/citronellal dehydrogenase